MMVEITAGLLIICKNEINYGIENYDNKIILSMYIILTSCLK